MTEPKPCPFCGGTVSVIKVDNVWWQVRCDDCPCDMGRYWFGTKRDAIEAWNRRVDNE